MALRSTNTLSLRGVTLPGLARLFDIHSLSDVRRRVQIAVVCDTASSATRIRVVTHVKVGLTDMTTLRGVGRVHLKDSTAVGLNHVSGTPVHLTPEPATMLHSVLDMAQILERHDGVAVFPGNISEFLSNDDAQFLATV